ncbi:MAG: hypothetical protein ACFFDJ_09070 [Candidatus Odinarchaeota archaeon]
MIQFIKNLRTFLTIILLFSAVTPVFSYPINYNGSLWEPESSETTHATLTHHKLPVNNEHYPEWNKTIGGTGSQTGVSVIECRSGGYAIVGRGTGMGGRDAFLIRLDQDGAVLWNQTYGGDDSDGAGAVVECSDGGFAITGGSSNFTTGDHTWLLRTDANGNQLWNYTYPVNNNDAFGTIIELSGGGFAVSGYTGSFGAGGTDVWLVFFDALGQPVQNFTYGGADNDFASRMIGCQGGGFVIAGSTHSYGEGIRSLWLLRLNDNGELVWNRTYGGAGWDSLYDVIECHGGNLALAGTANSTGVGTWDMILILTDINGHELWSKTFGGIDRDGAYGLIQLADLGFALGGWTYSFGAGSEDIWVVRTDQNGIQIWNQTFGGSSYDECFDIAKTSDGGFILVGDTYNFGIPIDVWLLYFKDDSQPFTPAIPLEVIVIAVIIILIIVIAGLILYQRRRTAS